MDENRSNIVLGKFFINLVNGVCRFRAIKTIYDLIFFVWPALGPGQVTVFPLRTETEIIMTQRLNNGVENEFLSRQLNGSLFL
jgi:hypothetical protein